MGGGLQGSEITWATATCLPTTSGRRIRRSKVSGSLIERLLKTREVVELRVAGRTFAAIGEALGVPERTVHRWFMEAVRRAASDEERELERTLELDRLDHLQSAVFAKAAQGDAQAISIVLQIMDRRAHEFSRSLDR